MGSAGCGPLAKYGEKCICTHCYAQGGAYCWKSVKNAQTFRLDIVTDSLRNDAGDAFVSRMVAEIGNNARVRKSGLFRVHDSGDLFSPAYAAAWLRICQALPNVQFWFPTREWARESMLPALRALAALPNVVIRPSAACVNDPARVVEGLQAGAAVFETAEMAEASGLYVCPAVKYAGSCVKAGCRRCWQKSAGAVAYPLH